MIKRHIHRRILELLKEFRIVYITGPRQSGKTTLSRIIAKDIGLKYFTLDNQAYFEAAMNDPHGLISSFGKRVVIDEFQYAPPLIPAIKMVSDSLTPHEKGVFLLTGSADIFKSASTQEAMPGHMVRIELLPLSCSEIKGTNLNLIDYLGQDSLKHIEGELINRIEMATIIIKGGFPEIHGKSGKSRRDWFKSYVSGRIFKDFKNLMSTRGDYVTKLHALSKLLAGLSGNLIKYANISNDTRMDDKTVKKYMSILELMFIIFQVKPYIRNQAKRDVLGMSKIHFIDTGLACYLLGFNKPESLHSSQFYGGMVENFVTMELIKHIQWAEEDVEVYHFRDKSKNEVDIVLEYDNFKIIGVEVKASVSVQVDDFKGLHALSEYAGKRFFRGILFYAGATVLSFKYHEQRFWAVPISLFWKNRTISASRVGPSNVLLMR